MNDDVRHDVVLTTQLPAAPLMGFADIQLLAGYIARSGLFGIKTPDQAVALMMIAQAEGIHPALAARDYDIIHGRPSKKAEAMLRDFLGQGGRVQWHNLDDSTADASFSHPAGGTVRITWDMERAKRAQILGEMWRKYPRQMLRSRTISEGVRTVWPLATSGMYVPEEGEQIVVDPSTPQIEHQPTKQADPERPQQSYREDINKATPLNAEPKKMTVSEWLDGFEMAAKACESIGAFNGMIATDKVQRALKEFKDSALVRLQSIIAVHITRLAPRTEAAEGEQTTDDTGMWPPAEGEKP